MYVIRVEVFKDMCLSAYCVNNKNHKSEIDRVSFNEGCLCV